MYIFKNAGRNILRAKGRSVLIGLIVCIIAFSSCIALIIMESAENTAQDGLKNLNITATIGVDRQKLMSDATASGGDPRDVMSAAKSLTLEEMQTYAASDQVQNFYYSLQSSLSGTDSLDPVETSDQTVEMSAMPGGPDGGQSGSEPTFTMGDFTVIGVNDATAMTSFTSGDYTMADGQVFTFDAANNECVISEELALLNGINVGDSITLTNPGDATETYSLTVTGIYSGSSETASSASQGRGFMASMDPSNQIYTNYETLSALIDSSSTANPLISSIQGTYVLGTPAALEAFQADVTDMGLSDTYTVSSNDLTNYENSLLPLTNLKKFATVLLLLVLGIGGIILTLFSIFIIRERKYEVGVLTAIGMKKKNVAVQFLTEAFLVAIIGVMVGTGLGAAFSQPVADVLLADQISSIQEQQTNQMSQFGREVGMSGGPGGGGQITNVDNYIDSLSPSMDLSVVLSLAGICVLLSLLASSAALIFVMRYEPMRILSERE
jgi:putative ABC transport system permease protein